jgi:hypothetical protein
VVAVQYVGGQLQLVYTGSSRWSCPASPSWARHLEQRLAGRLAQGRASSWAPLDAALLGSCTDEDQPWCSVRQALQRSAVEGGGPQRYRLLARLARCVQRRMDRLGSLSHLPLR